MSSLGTNSPTWMNSPNTSNLNASTGIQPQGHSSTNPFTTKGQKLQGPFLSLQIFSNGNFFLIPAIIIYFESIGVDIDDTRRIHRLRNSTSHMSLEQSHRLRERHHTIYILAGVCLFFAFFDLVCTVLLWIKESGHNLFDVDILRWNDYAVKVLFIMITMGFSIYLIVLTWWSFAYKRIHYVYIYVLMCYVYVVLGLVVLYQLLYVIAFLGVLTALKGLEIGAQFFSKVISILVMVALAVSIILYFVNR